MRLSVIVVSLLLLIICTYSIFELKSNDTLAVDSTRQWYHQSVDNLDKKVDLLCKALAEHQSAEVVQHAFKETRLAYKKIELVVEFYHPYTAQFMNGAGKETQNFQVLEATIFPVLQPDLAYTEARKLKSVMGRLEKESKVIQPTDAQLFDAMRLELVRIMSLGLSGFDSPQAQNSLPEAVASLDGINEIWKFYVPKVNIYNPALVKYMDELMVASKSHLEAEQDFNRDQFVTEYVNNLAINLKMAREALRIPYDNQQYILDPAASNIFARNAILSLYSSPDTITVTNDPVYNVNGQHYTARYLHSLLRQNSALNSYVRGE
jgi:cytochrome c peroxidase